MKIIKIISINVQLIIILILLVLMVIVKFFLSTPDFLAILDLVIKIIPNKYINLLNQQLTIAIINFVFSANLIFATISFLYLISTDLLLEKNILGRIARYLINILKFIEYIFPYFQAISFFTAVTTLNILIIFLFIGLIISNTGIIELYIAKLNFLSICPIIFTLSIYYYRWLNFES